LFTLNIDEVLNAKRHRVPRHCKPRQSQDCKRLCGLIYPPLKRKFETDDVCANDKFAPKPP